MTHLLAAGIPKGTGFSLVHDILIIAHYLFAWAFIVLGLGVLWVVYSAHPAVKLWMLVIPAVLAWLATGQFPVLQKWSDNLAKGASAHIGTATSDVSPGTLAVLIVLVAGGIFLIRRGREGGEK